MMAEKDIYVIGLPESGKHTFMALLSHTASLNPSFDISTEKGSAEINRIISSLMNGKWPESTDSNIRLKMIYKKTLFKKTYTISLKEISDVNDKVSLYFSLNASGLIFLIDSTKNSPEILGTMIENIMNLRKGEKLPPSIAVITKVDKTSIDLPQSWLNENYPLFVSHLRSSARAWKSYAVRVYTEDGKPAKPLMVDGMEPILSWIVENVR
jgi:signal recognition particle receptor subunit beta